MLQPSVTIKLSNSTEIVIDPNINISSSEIIYLLSKRWKTALDANKKIIHHNLIRNTLKVKAHIIKKVCRQKTEYYNADYFIELSNREIKKLTMADFNRIWSVIKNKYNFDPLFKPLDEVAEEYLT